MHLRELDSLRSVYHSFSLPLKTKVVLEHCYMTTVMPRDPEQAKVMKLYTGSFDCKSFLLYMEELSAKSRTLSIVNSLLFQPNFFDKVGTLGFIQDFV